MFYFSLAASFNSNNEPTWEDYKAFERPHSIHGIKNKIKLQTEPIISVIKKSTVLNEQQAISGSRLKPYFVVSKQRSSSGWRPLPGAITQNYIQQIVNESTGKNKHFARNPFKREIPLRNESTSRVSNLQPINQSSTKKQVISGSTLSTKIEQNEDVSIPENIVSQSKNADLKVQTKTVASSEDSTGKKLENNSNQTEENTINVTPEEDSLNDLSKFMSSKSAINTVEILIKQISKIPDIE